MITLYNAILSGQEKLLPLKYSKNKSTLNFSQLFTKDIQYFIYQISIVSLTYFNHNSIILYSFKFTWKQKQLYTDFFKMWALATMENSLATSR